MKIVIAVAVLVVVAATAIVGGWYGFKDTISMHPRSRKPLHPDHRDGLLTELAALDQQIAKMETLTVSESDDASLKRATEILAEARELRRDVEGKLRAEDL